METPAQAAAMKSLERQGFRFANWIRACPDAENEPSEGTEQLQCAVMIRRPNRFTREYREVDPQGNIN